MANLMRWDPFGEIYSIRDTVNRMFGPSAWQPTVDVIDRPKELVLRADLPGLDQKDLEVTLNEETITLKGEIRSEAEEEIRGYYRRERTRGSFARVIPLNMPVKPEEAKATFRNGLLEVVMPKAERVHTQGRRLDIQ